MAVSVCYARPHSTLNESFAQSNNFCAKQHDVHDRTTHQILRGFLRRRRTHFPDSAVRRSDGRRLPDYKKAWPSSRAAIALGICFVFAIGGRKFLDLMGISLSSFRIAGGTLLFLISLEMVFAHPSGTRSTTAGARGIAQAPGYFGFSAGVSLHGRARRPGDDPADGRRGLGKAGLVRWIPGCRDAW